jgi:CCR4-NOT transcription complex subunit 1
MTVSKSWSSYPSNAETSEDGDLQPSSWNMDVFVKSVNETMPKISWNKVYGLFDSPGFKVNDLQGMTMLVDIFHIATNGARFPLEIMFQQWKNKDAHLSLVREAIMAPVELINFKESPRVFQPLPGIHMPQSSLLEHEPPESTFGISNQAWLSVDLVETLLRLSESHLFYEVQQLFKPPLDYLPEILLCILSQIPFQCTLKEQIHTSLLPKHMINHPNSGVVLATLWNIDSHLIIQWMVRLYLKDPGFLSRILDIAQDLKVQEALTAILRARPFIFAIDLATLASRREFLNLEKWLNLQIGEHGRPFIISCVEYIRDYVDHQSGRSQGVIKRHCIPLMTWDTVKLFFDCLKKNGSLLSPELTEEVTVLAASCNQAPKARADVIEKEANAYFQKIYDSSLSIAEMVDVLFRFMNSADPREIEIYQCMIHSLFDEYRFFKKYPERELQVTGVLFGTLIAKDLLNPSSMQLAIRYVLDSLRQLPDSKLYRFGIWALEQFLHRIPQLPEFYVQLMEIHHFRSSNPDLFEFLRNAGVAAPVQASGMMEGYGIPVGPGAQMMGAPPGGVPVQPIVPIPQPQAVTPVEQPAPPVEKPVKKVWQKIDADALLQSYGDNLWDSLDTNVREKLSFQINAVVMLNVGEKAAEISNILQPQYFEHFAQYLVAKRVAVEQNNQEVYLNLLKKMNLAGFTKAILKATYHCVNVLLDCDNVLNPGPERNLLKNLGLWLGELTIARNRPPLAKYVNLKKLLLDGFEHNKLSATVPLVCKILLGCGKSKVFKPPNPWLMSLLSILVETYQLEIRLNIKFEIEMVFTKLQLEIDEVPVRNHFARITADKRAADVKVKEPELKAEEVKAEPASQAPVDTPVDVPVAPRPRGIVIDPS